MQPTVKVQGKLVRPQYNYHIHGGFQLFSALIFFGKFSLTQRETGSSQFSQGCLVAYRIDLI